MRSRSSAAIARCRAAAGAACGEARRGRRAARRRRGAAAGAWVDIPPYQIDVLVRGSESLAKTKDGREARAVL